VGVRQSLFILPVISLLSYSVVAFVPLLPLVRGIKTLENATDYSLQNTLRQALFLPTSREAKYKAKAAIDTFFMRTGDVLQAGVVGVGTQLQLALSGFAWLNVALTGIWLWVATALARRHRKMNF
jgi:AAA family ATP:ADP antiporter